MIRVNGFGVALSCVLLGASVIGSGARCPGTGGPGADQRPGAGQPGQAAAQAGVRSDRRMAARQQPTSPFRFAPPPGFKLTPQAQVHYDAARKAQAEGGVYRDDIGQCWPAGLPVIMTRVWPIAMMQYPTAIYMVSEFMNSLRVVYFDRPAFRPGRRGAQP